MDQALHPELYEYFFEVVNSLLTVTRAVGTVAGIATLIRNFGGGRRQGNSSTHRKRFHNNDIDT